MQMMWSRLTLFVTLGYLTFGRSFAYIGIAPLKIFIGELFLIAFIAFRSRAVLAEWFQSLLDSRRQQHNVAWAILLFLQYGIFEALRGISQDYSVLTAIQNLVFTIYPLYFFVGLWAGKDPQFLRRVVRIQFWITAIYGPLYIFFLNHVTAVIPFSTVPIFGFNGALLAMLGAICFEPDLRRIWLPFVLNAFVLLASQVRSEWLAFVLSLAVWSVITGRIRRFVVAVAITAGILVVGYAADLRLPSPRGRGGEISSREIVARAAAAIDPAWAVEHSSMGRFYAGTISWRKTWWAAIWESVHSKPSTALLGEGFGFPLRDLVSYLRGGDLRTPHNIFFFVLGYMGWIGVTLFAFFLFTLWRLMWRTFRLTGQPFGVLAWLAGVIASLFGNLFEAPSGAIPFYLLIGLAAATISSRAELVEEHVLHASLNVPPEDRRYLLEAP